MSEKIKVVIDYDKWKTATHGAGKARLLNEEGYQCCLGFVCEAAGVERDELRECGAPQRAFGLRDLVGEDGIFTGLTTEAISANDDPAIDDRSRVVWLRRLFAKTRYELEWVNLPWEKSCE